MGQQFQGKPQDHKMGMRIFEQTLTAHQRKLIFPDKTRNRTLGANDSKSLSSKTLPRRNFLAFTGHNHVNQDAFHPWNLTNLSGKCSFRALSIWVEFLCYKNLSTQWWVPNWINQRYYRPTILTLWLFKQFKCASISNPRTNLQVSFIAKSLCM